MNLDLIRGQDQVNQMSGVDVVWEEIGRDFKRLWRYLIVWWYFSLNTVIECKPAVMSDGGSYYIRLHSLLSQKTRLSWAFKAQFRVQKVFLNLYLIDYVKHSQCVNTERTFWPWRDRFQRLLWMWAQGKSDIVGAFGLRASQCDAFAAPESCSPDFIVPASVSVCDLLFSSLSPSLSSSSCPPPSLFPLGGQPGLEQPKKCSIIGFMWWAGRQAEGTEPDG